jgi:hypothetical protein
LGLTPIPPSTNHGAGETAGPRLLTMPDYSVCDGVPAADRSGVLTLPPERRPSSPRRLSEELAFLIGEFRDHPVRLRDIMTVLHGRAWTMLLLILALPFCTPIPLPGLSTAFGLVIALIGFRLSLGQKPWLPVRLLDIQLPSRFFPQLLSATRRLVCLLEFFLRPRMTWFLNRTLLHHACGAMVMSAGVLLLLPLPIPFSNILPALTVVLIAGALLERDGYAVLAGTLMFGLCLCFFGAIAFGGAEAVDWLHHQIRALLRFN